MPGAARRPVLLDSMGRVALAALLVTVACGDGGGGDERAPRPRGQPALLASCGGDDGDGDDGDGDGSGPPGGGPVAITLSHGEGGLRGDLLGELVEEFDAAHPDIDVSVEYLPDGYGARLRRWRSQAPAQRPHLILLPHQATGRLVDSGQTLAPGACLAQAVPDVLPAIEASWSAHGDVQAVPLSVSTPLLFYNRALFAAAGLDPDDPPATLGEVRDAARALVAAGVAERGLVFDTSADACAQWLVEHLPARVGVPAVEPGNGRGPRPVARVGWRDGPAVDVLAWLQDMVDEGLAESVGRNTSGTDNFYRAVEAGSYVGMTFHTSTALPELLDILDTGFIRGVDLGVAPLPHPETASASATASAGDPEPEPGAGGLPGGSALWLAAGKPEREAAATWALAAFLASPPVNARWAAATGYLPLGPTAAGQEPLRSAWAARPLLRVPYDLVAEYSTAPHRLSPLAGPLPEIHELLALATEDVVAGADPARTLAAAADDADRLLATYDASRPGSPRSLVGPLDPRQDARRRPG